MGPNEKTMGCITVVSFSVCHLALAISVRVMALTRIHVEVDFIYVIYVGVNLAIPVDLVGL